jgi:type IV secretion system protein VirB10
MTPDANDRGDREPDSAADPAADANTISPLPGEPGIPNVATRPRISISKKGLLAVGLLLGGIVTVLAFTIQQFSATGKADEEADSRLVRDKPTAATAEPRRLEMPVAPPASAVAASEPAAAPRIPALSPTADELAEPIGVRRTGAGAPASGGQKAVLPEDAPILLVSSRPGAFPVMGAPARRGESPTPPAEGTGSFEGEGPGGMNGMNATTDPNDPLSATSRHLQEYQRQLQGMLDKLTQSAEQATGLGAAPAGLPMLPGALLGGPSMAGVAPGGVPTVGGGLFGGQLQGSPTPKVAASTLGNRSLTLPKGTAFTCALKTKVISATSGLVGCQVQRNVFSDDGRVLLIERGSHLDGEYRVTSVRPGTVRIPVLWTRIRTPLGVTVDIESPGTGQLGESGIDAYVDNRWFERIGAAMLVSLIDDTVKLVISNQANETTADTILLPSTTANTSKLAEKVLESTINIPPLLYQNQGGIVGIYVARDVDFSSVYELRPVER